MLAKSKCWNVLKYIQKDGYGWTTGSNNIRKFGKNILFYVLLYLIDTRLNVNVIEHL